MKYSTLRTVVAIALLGLVTASDVHSQGCQSAEQRQFDFWIGSWSLSWPAGDSIGHGTNVVTQELSGCVIEENFSTTGEQPFVGNSLSVYDTTAGLWKQTWVDNNGSYLDFTGGMLADSMILSRSFKRNGTEIWQRMVFFNITIDTLDWEWQSSTDFGHSWNTLWHIDYRRLKM
jgi:hypothetical protein